MMSLASYSSEVYLTDSNLMAFALVSELRFLEDLYGNAINSPFRVSIIGRYLWRLRRAKCRKGSGL